jgi:DNA repair photolyase
MNNKLDAFEKHLVSPKVSGTHEWAVRSVNCCSGCSHDCRYCYARDMAVRFGQLTRDQWKEERIRWKDVYRNYPFFGDRVMFPSSHDITPSNFDPCFRVLKSLLAAGNKVLVVSKPHLDCVQEICRGVRDFRGQILFRFTIGARNDEVLRLWEPNAPPYQERKAALRYAFETGYETSVSIEPMLDSENIDALVEDLSPLVSDSTWIGLMNYTGRIAIDSEEVRREVEKIRAGQTNDKIMAIYERHRDNTMIKWKASIKKIVGIPLAEEPGMDI